ncbi:MAG: T9SS type A sorting domain-containing protein [Bacteroidales bacterium]|nr:T9SS type A sorting domain-containing protein [Bacteroidales bacterium]
MTRRGLLVLLMFLLVGLGGEVRSQETIKIMQYNLLYYGKNTNNCTSVSNYIVEKNRNLKTIIKYVKPDIFSVNELDGQGVHPETHDAQYLLDNALNVDGVDYYRKTEFQRTYLANTLFYNSNKLILKSHTPIVTYNGGYQKIFNVYTFYFNSRDLATTNDTAYFSCLVAHLKAGSYSDNQQQRVREADKIMQYYESLGREGNYLLMGDFNVYSASEQAFQKFINPENTQYRFHDPVNQLGNWSKNQTYRNYHTQSTHTGGDCFSGGGMDDRFDFILASSYIMNGTQHYSYVDDSYKAIGQDGSYFNRALNTSTNSTISSNVAHALYNMSDHLPVYMEMQVDQNLGEPVDVYNPYNNRVEVKYNNPVDDNLNLNIEGLNSDQIFVQFVSMQGVIVYSNNFKCSNNVEFNIPLNDLSAGMYILQIKTRDNLIYNDKLLVK